MNLETKPVPKTNGHQAENGAPRIPHRLDDTNNGVDSCVISGSATKDDGLNNASDDHERVSCIDKIISWRCAMVVLLHLSFMVASFARLCMPIALICMTEQPSETVSDQQSSNESLMNVTTGIYMSENEKDFEFSWDAETQGIILSSTSFLSFLAPLLANFVRPYFGHKNTLTFMTFASVVTLFLTPVAARANSWFVVSLRIILGGTFGANVPVIGDCVARWAPRMEKQTMVTFIFTGLQTGGMLCSLLSGYMCLIPIDNGWPFIFYIIGAVNVLWMIGWHFVSSVNPEDNKFISEKELSYIKRHREWKDTEHKKKTEKPPYKTILSSPKVIALLISTSCHFWAVNTFFTYLPIYFASVFDFSVTETGVIMTIMSTVRFVGMGFFTATLNWMMGTKRWSVTAVKKFTLSAGTSVTIGGLIPVMFMTKDMGWVVVAFFMVTMFFHSSAGCVIPSVPLDMAPRYAGFLTGLAFSLGGLVTVSGPLIVAALTTNNTRDEWQRVWIVVVCVLFILIVSFLFFGDCELQSWARDDREDAPEVVSPFDSMRRRFSAAMNTSPMVSLDVSTKVQSVDNVHQIELEVRPGKSSSSSAPTIESSLAQPSFHRGDCSRDVLDSPTSSDGVLNDGFEFELDRSLPELSNKDTEYNVDKAESADDVIDVRF